MSYKYIQLLTEGFLPKHGTNKSLKFRDDTCGGYFRVRVIINVHLRIRPWPSKLFHQC